MSMRTRSSRDFSPSPPWDDAACRVRLVKAFESAERQLARAKRNIENFDKGEFYAEDRAAKGLPN